MKDTLLILWLLFIYSTVFSQKQGQAKIDSLEQELPNIHNDTIKARLIKSIVEEYFFIDADKALTYGKLGLAHATSMKWNRGIAVFNSAIGRAYSDKGNYDSCIYFLQLALNMHKMAEDKRNMASVLNNLGTAEQNLNSNYPKATQYYFEALKLAETLNDNYITAVCLDNISVIYLHQKNYQKALDYDFRALHLREKGFTSQDVSILREIGNSLSSIAAIYTEMNKVNKAIEYHQKAIKIHKNVGNMQGLAKSYSNMAYLSGTDYQRKIEYILKAKKIYDELNPNHLEAINNLAYLGITYLELVKADTSGNKRLKTMQRNNYIKKSESYLQSAIALSDKIGEVAYKTSYLGNLAELQAIKGDYKNAYTNISLYHNAQDSLYSQKSKNEIAAVESAREIALRDKEIKLNMLALKSQKRQRFGLLVGIILLAIIGSLLFWQNKTRKRTNITLLHLNNELDEANKIKAKFFGILSHDLRSPVANLINFLHLQKEEPELFSGKKIETHQKRISESAETLLETMESMLLWSKGQMQNFKPQIKQLEVSGLFDYLKKFFADTQGVELSFNNTSNLKVASDEDYLKTIMQNLTGNAIKALKNTPKGNIRWEARMVNNHIVLAIIDNGPGITEHQLNSLYNEESVLSSKMGLGLHIIRDLAKAISCEVAVSSKPDSGSEFQLIFVNG